MNRNEKFLDDEGCEINWGARYKRPPAGIALSDEKIPVDVNNDFLADYYKADIVSAQDYYPFGMLMPKRNFSTSKYTYSFNGKLRDDNVYGKGNFYNYGFRMYDSRLGRWLSLDPLQKKYPNLSPYNFVANSPIRFVDFDGEDFGVKINHTNKTIVIVANVYTTSAKAYKQALKSAGAWNAKSATSGGYTVSFQVKVQKPKSVTDAQAIKYDPSIVKKNGKYRKGRLAAAKNKLSIAMAKGDATVDDIGNVYSGNSGEYSEYVSGNEFVGGVTVNGVLINMNTHSEMGDMGAYQDPVTHEFGHLFGLDDEGGTYYPGDDGIMEYKGTDMSPISDDDVNTILDFAKDALNGKTGANDAKVKLLENTGNSDGSNPLGVKNEEK